jgi:membrane-associated PAP2 superfamily phosphatase
VASLLAWDAIGFDLPAERWFGDAHGFRWHDTWWSTSLLHDGGRWLAWGLAGGLFLIAVRAARVSHAAPNRSERLRSLATMLVCASLVPLIKRFSATSCPWDLAEFGGHARHVLHWRWGVADGGPGHCFPAGHAVAGFAFFAMYFMWREHDRARSRAWLIGAWIAGLVLGAGQLARGAHYISHILWSAWACWSICACAYWIAGRRARRLARHSAAARGF